MKSGILMAGVLAAVGVVTFAAAPAFAAPKQNNYSCAQLVATPYGPNCLKWVQSDRGLPPPPFMAQAQQPQAVAAPVQPRKVHKKKKNRRGRH